MLHYIKHAVLIWLLCLVVKPALLRGIKPQCNTTLWNE